MLKKPFILPISILFILSGIWLIIYFYAPTELARLQNNPDIQIITTSTSFTSIEVNTHNTNTDCWTIIEDKIYNVTSFIDQHPGGERILQACGIDATTLFKTDFPHTPEGENVLKDYFIGNLKK
jgi:cytochrome b involved in lipid metabolism